MLQDEKTQNRHVSVKYKLIAWKITKKDMSNCEHYSATLQVELYRTPLTCCTENINVAILRISSLLFLYMVRGALDMIVRTTLV